MTGAPGQRTNDELVATLNVPVGLNATGDGFTQHYFDSRGVVRVYAMTLNETTWQLPRETPDCTPLEFGQRFSGLISADGLTREGTWKIRHDSTGEHDFDVRFRKVV